MAADTELAKPIPGQLVDTPRLQQVLYTSRLSSIAFSGLRDPTSIWQMMVRNDGAAIPLYRELEEKDDDVSAALDELKYSVLEREWSIEPGDESQAALDARDFAEDQLNSIDFDATMDCLLDAAPYGFAVGEIMYDTSMGQAALLSIDDSPQELFLFGGRYEPQVGPVQLLSGPLVMGGQPVPEEKFAIFTYRGRARSRIGRPLLRKVFWPSWFKRQILGIWLKTGEKSNGTAIARYADGASASEQEEAVQCAEALVDGNAFAIPAGMIYDTELLKIASSRNAELCEKLFTQMQYAIARAIKGETLTSFGNEGGKGSNAQGKTHADTFDKRSVSLAKQANRVITRDVLGRLHRWNFSPDVPAPVFGYDVDQDEDLTRKLAIFTGAQKIGVPIPGKWAAAQLEIPPVSDDDPALTPNATDAIPALPGAAFAELTEAEQEVARDLNRLDKLSAQMKQKAINQFRTRIREVAQSAVDDLGGK